VKTLYLKFKKQKLHFDLTKKNPGLKAKLKNVKHKEELLWFHSFHFYSKHFCTINSALARVEYALASQVLTKSITLFRFRFLSNQFPNRRRQRQEADSLENRLVIPKIGVDSEILEGSSLDVLLTKEGVWREPYDSTPDQDGNVMIAGHRFQYLPPNTHTFYNLEEVTAAIKL